jgi:hypothetical protein
MTGKALLLAPLLLASPLAAQEFEGVIAFRMAMSNGGQQEMMDGTMTMKGTDMVMAAKLPASAGPMAGQHARAVVDNANRTVNILMPMPPGMPAMNDAKGVKMSMKLDELEGKVGDVRDVGDVDLKKLATSQVIAGTRCDDFELTVNDEQPIRLCLSKALGRFTLLDLVARGRKGSSMPDWAKALQKDGYFPLKVWSVDNDIAFEVTSVQRKPVPDTAFIIPSGYMDMSGMGMGRRQ